MDKQMLRTTITQLRQIALFAPPPPVCEKNVSGWTDNRPANDRHHHLYDRQFLPNLQLMFFSFLFLLYRIIY